MMLLVTTGLPDMVRFASPYLGRLFQPRAVDSVKRTAELVPWAADNDCYNGGLKVGPFLKMLSLCADHEGCLFVSSPDVVGDARETMRLFARWAPIIHDCNLPVAYVLQDGLEGVGVPWDQCEAVFVGGTTGFKMGDHARRTVAEAKERGKWVHMGRVNSWRRIEYAASIGCDSVDGTQFSMFKDTYIPRALRWLETHQGSLLGVG